MARVKTILRRCQPNMTTSNSQTNSNNQTKLIIDENAFQVRYGSQLLELTPAEFRLLKFMSDNAGMVFSRDQLLDILYDDHRVVTDRTIDSHVKNLRRKLESLDNEKPLFVQYMASATVGMNIKQSIDILFLWDIWFFYQIGVKSSSLKTLSRMSEC